VEIEDLQFKIVMDDGPDTEVLGRVRDLDFGFAVFTAAIAKYPFRTIYLRHGARIIRKHEGV
jgi:hypothetical protein